jgi:Response regulator containing a CheY-like receiver domain and an HTH DNA-binding domain
MDEDYSAADEWVFTPRSGTLRHDGIVKSLGNELLQTILNVVQDGICIIDRDLDIIYANPAMACWFPVNKGVIGTKCHQSYHQLPCPCDECPSITAFETGEPQTTVKSYDKPGKEIGWHRVFSVPILDGKGDPVLVIEYIREITSQRRAEDISEFSEAQNRMLMDFLEQKERERETFEQTVVNNVELCVKPVLNYLESALGRENMELVKRQLDSALSGLRKNTSFPSSVLSPRELEVAHLIKENLASKEIAKKLAITKKAVDFHRTNIRKKLGLKPDESLRIFLDLNI